MRPSERGYRRSAAIVVVLLVIVAILGGSTTPAEGQARDEIGEGRPVEMGRATWDTGWFQAEVYRHLLQELGYQVARPETFENADFFAAVDSGAVDFWANGWFPLFANYLASPGGANTETVGTQVRGGALQGYLVDKKSADAFQIATVDDLARDDVIANFDGNGDGRADLIGCNAGWACAEIIEHHLDAYGLRTSVEHMQGDYSPLAQSAIKSYFDHGDPVLMFTWTPNWTVGKLELGEDVVWLEVPFPALPEDLASASDDTLVPNVQGCRASPCSMGFPANDIQAVANSDFLAQHPAINVLLAQVEIPIDAILAQNAVLISGEDTQADIERHAAEWIAANRSEVESWLDAAVAAHDSSLLGPSTVSPQAESSSAIARPTLRLVTKPLAPFVMYESDEQDYTGFSIELWKLIAADAGVGYEMYAVDSVAKLLDEVERGAADVAISGIGITEQREQALDFSHAYLDSGLQIMTSADGRSSGLLGVLGAVFSRQLLNIVVILLLTLLAAAHVMWFFERRVNDDFDESYVKGVWEALWWSAVTATTVGYGDKTPKTVIGRSIGLVWMFSGLFVLASFSASIATALAIEEVTGNIQGPADLHRVSVGTVERSTAEEYLDAIGIRPVSFEQEEQAYQALRDETIDALVYDAPVLAHYAAHEGRGEVELAGPEFQTQRYGIALAPGLELREDLNRALLRLIESGDYADLHETWFGAG